MSFGTMETGRAIGPPLIISNQKALKYMVEAEKAELKLVGDPKVEPAMYRLCKITPSLILCIGQCPESNPEETCRGAGKKEDVIEATPPGNVSGAGIAARFKQQTFRFHLRSVQEVMYYLGELLRYQRGSGRTVFAKDRRVLFELTVDKASAEKPFVSTTYEDKTYYLAKPPKGTQSRAGSVLALVSQLFGLHKKSEELPTTTTIKTVGGGS